jgi:hypothetical protein
MKEELLKAIQEKLGRPTEKKEEKKQVEKKVKEDTEDKDLELKVKRDDYDEARDKFKQLYGRKEENEEEKIEGLSLKVNGKEMTDVRDIIKWLETNKTNLLKN